MTIGSEIRAARERHHMSSRAAFHLLPGTESAARAAELATMSPRERLRAQELDVFESLAALRWGAGLGLQYAVVGDVAALLHGLPVPLRTMRVLVLDTDESLDGLEQLLLEAGLLFTEVGPDRLRTWPERTWAFPSADVTLQLVRSLPLTTTLDLEGLEVRVATPAEVLRDPVIAELTRHAG